MSDCHLTEVLQWQGPARNETRRTEYYCHFTFTDPTGKKYKILYDKDPLQREMEVPMERSRGN